MDWPPRILAVNGIRKRPSKEQAMFAKALSAVAVLALAGTAGTAAPITPLPGASEQQPLITVQRRFGGYHPLVHEPGAWTEHNRQWDQYQRGEPVTSCRSFRSYDPYTRTYVTKNGRRIACPYYR
jgi:hypothetical protein